MKFFPMPKLYRKIWIFLLICLVFSKMPHPLFACSGNGEGCTDDCCDGDGDGDDDGDSEGDSALVRASKTSCLGCSAANHVIESSGNLYLQLRPFKLKGLGAPIEPVLTYNSKGEKVATPYGRGWILNYDRRIKVLNAEKTKIECEDGRGNIYTYNLNANTYTAKKRRHQGYSELYHDSENSQYVEEYKSEMEYRFIMDGEYGYIAGITDRHGNSLTFTRDAAHKIQTITDSSG